MARDLRHALRGLLRTPTFTLLALACLVLGIGASTTIFSVLNSVFLKPLPFADVGRLVMIWDVHTSPEGDSQHFNPSPLNYFAWKDEARSFEGVGGLTAWSFNLTAEGEPERIEGAYVTAGLLPVLGVEPVLGRGIRPEEDGPGAPADVVVVSHGLWSRRFGSDPDLVGSTLTLDGRVHTVVGILAPGFAFPFEAELWVPATLDPGNTALGRQHFLATIARLGEGATRNGALAELETLARRLEQERPETNSGWGVELTSFRDELLGDVGAKLRALGAGVIFLLLISCANVGCLVFARTAAQEGNLAIQAAMGASRGRLIRRLLAESFLLALAGGLGGTALAAASLGPVARLAPAITLPEFFQDIRIDPRVLAFSVLVTAFSGLVVGLLSALRYSRPGVESLLASSSRGTGSVKSHRSLESLVAAEVALATLLLIAAGLMGKSFQHLQEVDIGFDPENVLTLRLHLSGARYPEGSQRSAFVSEVVERIAVLPGVRSAGATTTLPLSTLPRSASFTVEGRARSQDSEVLLAPYRLVTPGYLETMGIELRAGRGLGDLDHEKAPGVAVVSEEMARRYWPGLDTVGRRVKRGAAASDNPWLTVVGVARDVKDSGLDSETSPAWYLPYRQHAATDTALGVSLVVRTDSNPRTLVDAVRREVWAVDADQPVFDVATLDEIVSESISQKRLTGRLLALFAALGLVLASVGIFGVMSYTVSQRTREMGIRQAFGARTGDLTGKVLRRGLGLTLAGLAIGVVASSFFTRLLASELYGISPTDPRTYVEISVFFTAVALAACYFPARKAARVDPVESLREG